VIRSVLAGLVGHSRKELNKKKEYKRKVWMKCMI
jgi:hypothetical protein